MRNVARCSEFDRHPHSYPVTNDPTDIGISHTVLLGSRRHDCQIRRLEPANIFPIAIDPSRPTAEKYSHLAFQVPLLFSPLLALNIFGQFLGHFSNHSLRKNCTAINNVPITYPACNKSRNE